MITYKYKAQGSDGHVVNGIIKSYDEYEAVSTLRESGVIVTSIEEVKEEAANTGLNMKIGSGKIKEKDLAILCSQFEIIITAGLPIVRCIRMVAEQTVDKEFRRILFKVAEDVDSGMSMAQSFENNASKKLPKTFIETIRAGEMSGTLEECFRRLKKYYDKSAKTKAKIVSALTYPAIVIVIAIVVFIIIMVVAVPMFVDVFESLGSDLPVITKALIGFSNFFLNYWWILLAVVVALAAAWVVAMHNENGKKAITAFKLTRSPLHKINVMNAAGQFASTMSTMIAAGLPITKALDITSAVVNNYTFSLAIRDVKQGVEQGRSMTDIMKKIKYFPSMLTEMTGVGEQSGSLESTLDVIADYFNNEVEIKTNRLLALMEPIITIALAVIVVILLLAVYLPLFTMYGSM